MADQKPPAAPPAGSVNDLLGDLDAFSRTVDMEAAELARHAEEEKRRKEEALRAAQAAAAAAEQAKRAQQSAATASAPPGPRKAGALDLLKKQATASAPREDPAVVRARMLATLNQQMREADRYLAEFILAIKQQRPAASQPYPFLHLGKLPNIVLGDGWIDSRPRRIEGVDHMAHIVMRYKIYADPPAKLQLLKDDMPPFEHYLKLMEAPYTVNPVQKNDFGQVLKAEYLIQGGPLCEIIITADYDNGAVQFDLRNVRQLGKTRSIVPPEGLADVADELARYILGADEDFGRRLSPVK